MGTLLQAGEEWLASQLKEAGGEWAIYSRGSNRVAVKVVPTGPVVDLDDGIGAVLQTRRADFIIQADSLVIDGARTTPQAGDRIEVPFAGTHRRTYEVMPVGTDSHYRPIGSYDTAWRVHTKVISEA